MEPAHTIYNQAGPSNYAVPYAQEGRPHYGAGRGRGHANHRHANANYHQAQQQQPFFTHGVPNSYAGYSLGMNGTGSGPIHGRYGHSPNGVHGRPGPSYHTGNFQPPSSPALHPVPVYNHHPTPFIPSAATSGVAPVYPYSHPPAHLHPYPTPFSPPFQHPLPSFPNHQRVNSPSLSPHVENAGNLPRSSKSQHSLSPRPLQVSPTPLPSQQEEMPSSTSLSSSSPLSPLASDEPPPPSEPLAPTPLKPSLTITENQITPLPNSPMSPTISLPSFDNEPAPQQEWVISASRPDDPAAAFGIMISPKAKPPSHIIEGALEYISPTRPKGSVEKRNPVGRSESNGPDCTGTPGESFAEVGPSQSEQVSCSTTETERTSTVPDTFVAGSPLSTATSVSIAGPKADGLSQEESQSHTMQDDPEPSTIAESPKAISANVPPVTDSPDQSSSTKKSWASLLRPENSQSSKTGLPTSSIQGFSIPAQSVTSPSVTSGSRDKSAELLRLLDNGPSGSSSVPQIRPRGLINTGNMCFANAILQTLVYTPPFSRLFTELASFKVTGPDSTKWAGKETPLVDAIVQFLKEFKPKIKEAAKGSYEDEDDFSAIDSFIPSYVYDAMKEKSRFDNMGGGQQEDAEEFLGFFLDTIEEELLGISESLKEGSHAKTSAQDRSSTEGDDWMEVGKKNKPIIARTVKSVDSPMTRIFGGKFRSTLRVPGQRDSVVVEDWRSLQLDIQRDQVETIEDALRYIAHPQTVQMPSVTKGGAIVEASQQVLVDSLPPILVLHLKRFLYDTAAQDVIKVHKQVTYGPELEIPSDVITPARRTAHPTKYKLFAVLYHHGSSAAGGHYTLDVLHPNRNADAKATPREGWIRIDDELVSDLRTEDVFGKDRDSAYLLFYRRIVGRVICTSWAGVRDQKVARTE